VTPEPLTQQERDDLGTLLSNPMEFPSEFLSWLPQYLAQNVPYVPVSQISGHQRFQPRAAIVNTSENSAGMPEHSWTDFATVGPVIDDVSAGDFLAIWGYYYNRGGTGGAQAECGPSVDGAAPTAFITPPFQTDQANFVWMAARIRVTGDAVHQVYLRYRLSLNSNNVSVAGRWLVLLRVK